MKHFFRSRIARRFFRIVIWLAVGLALVVMMIPWILDISPVRGWLEAQAGSRLGAKVTWRSIHWYFQDTLHLSRVQVQAGQSGRPFTATADTLHLFNLFTSNPQGEITNGEITWGGEHIASASQVSLLSRSGWKNARLEANLLRATLRIAPLIADSLPAAEPAPPVNLDFLDTIRFTDSRLILPGFPDTGRWNGSIRFSTREEVLLHAIITPAAQSDGPHAVMQASVKPSLDGINSLHLQIRRFPLTLTAPRSFSAVLDGTAALRSAPNGLYQAEGRMAIHSLVAPWSPSATVILSDATIQADLRLSSRFQPLAATAVVEHATLVIDASPAIGSTFPPGILTMQSVIRDHHLENGSLAWRSDRMDSFALAFACYPLISDSTMEGRVQIHDQSFSVLRSLLPIAWPAPLDTLEGRFSLDVMARGQGTKLDHYKATARLQQGFYRTASAAIQEVSLRAVAQGRPAVTASTPPTDSSAPVFDFNALLHDATFSGTANLLLPGLNDSPPIETTYTGFARYNPANGDYSLTLTQADSGIVHSVSGWLRSGGQWLLEGSLPLETGFPPLRDAYLPPWAATIEGMGELQFRLRSDGSSQPINLSATSADLSLFSLSDPLEFGVQLQNLTLEGRARLDSATPAWNVEIRGVTPYLSYTGYDYEWPGKPILLAVTQAADRTVSMRLIPPGGGHLRLEGRPGQTLQITSRELSLEEWVYPILSQWWNDTDASSLTPFPGYGRMNLDLTLRPSKNGYTAQGLVDLRIGSLTREDFLHARLKDARVLFPIGYPFTFANLPRPSIDVSAASLVWDNGAYQDIAFTIPIAKEAITLPTPVVFPLFGGEIYLDHGRITAWQTGTPRLEGPIRFDHLFLSHLSRIMPLFPAKGILNGFLDHIVYSGDQFEMAGRFEVEVFGGKLTVYNIFLRPAYGGSRRIGFDLDIERLDLQPLMEYFNFGEMTGVVSGRMRKVEVLMPPAGSGEIPLPVRLDIEIHSEGKGGYLGKEALSKIVQLGESSNVAVANLTRKRYEYSALGFKASLDGDQFRLTGTANGDYLIAHSKKLFANTIGIRLADSGKILSFQDFWNRLLAQTGRFQSGHYLTPRVTTQ